jgi:gamma-glutamyl-gamma-aminobutyrate hydrolase PuuD
MASEVANRKPLKIGISPRFLHSVPPEMGFRGKTLQYLEQSIAHWLTSTGAGALVFMIPSIAGGGVLRRGDLHVADYVAELDGLVLQGGADVSPVTYGETAGHPDWSGDRVRDTYEIDLLEEFAAAGKPVLGVCRGLQLINVACGGTLYQDLALHHPKGGGHHDPVAYDRHFHEVVFTAGSGLARLYPGTERARVNSIHHQGVKTLGGDLAVEAVSVPDEVIEAIRWQGTSYMVGVQWHPEFHDPADPTLLNGDPLLREFLHAAEQAKRR